MLIQTLPSDNFLCNQKLLQERIEQLRQKYGKTEGGEGEREVHGGTFENQHQQQKEEELYGRRHEEEDEGVLGCEREESEQNSLLFLEQEIEPSEVRRGLMCAC